MEAQYGKFLDMIQAVLINVPLVNVLDEMPNYGKFLKELVSNKHKSEQISAAFLSEESSAVIQNKVPPKLGDLGSFLIPCHFNQAFSCNALADLGASIKGFMQDFLQEITNRVACRKCFKKNKSEIFTVSGDGVRNSPDGVAPLNL
ncbi:hypothetical protein Tco_0663496 [Tanacetum coccineum]